MIFRWRDSFSTGISEIDLQHRKLFELGSRIYELAGLNDGYDHYDEIMAIIGELKDYTVYHFNYEEELMRKYGFEKLDSHKIEHDFFVKRLDRLLRKDIDSEQEEALMDMIKFTADWISSHILGTDMDYRDFLISRGAV